MQNSKFIISAVALGAFLGIGAASAADLPMHTKAPVIASPVYDWSGFYIGVNAGGGWNRGDLRADYLPSPSFGLNPTLTSSTGGGVVGGVHAGYNWAVGSGWVAGFEGDFSGASINSSATVIPTLFGTTVPQTSQPTSFSRNLNWLATARARFGYAVKPTLLLYVTGGGAWGSFDYNASFVNIAPGSNNWVAPFSATSSGYVVGGGGEWMVTNNWMVRAEYLYYRLSGKSNLASNPVFPTFPILFSWNATDTHTVRVGLSYKFGGPVVARY
jgi:outer membrane immunogenic protein